MKFRRPKRVYGARPPEGREWENGKTAATILFVHEAERFLELLPEDRWGYPEEAVELLRERVNDLKEGKVTLLDRQDVKGFLKLKGY